MTFYALSSGPGLSGIAVIRVSGSETVNVIKHLTNSSLPKPKEATLKKFINKNNELIDEGILLWFPGPNSYTGEDMAEFHVHGSRAVIEAIQSSISEVSNCRLASPGEFTKTAFQNGKIDLLKAEGISDLISSETEIQRLQAIKIMEGKSSKIFETLRHTLIKVLSKLEAKIDFPDEDLPIEILDGIKADTTKALADLEKLLDDQRVGERIREGFKISIIGPTNVGKSSLLNHLANREVAIVSEIAGTTRDVIETHLNLDGYPVILSDTAGIRDSKDEIERKGIKLSLKNANEADLNFIVLVPKSVDFQMLKKQLIISYPLAIQEFLVMLSLTAFYKIIAIIGIIELAATQIIFKIMHTSFMPAIGIGQACATLVGKYLGEENSNKAELSIYESIRGSLYIMGVMGLIFIIFSESIVSIFIKDISVIKLAAPGLKFIGFLQFIDAFCFTLWFALTGAGDTRIPAIFDILNHWLVFVPLCYFLGIYF